MLKNPIEIVDFPIKNGDFPIKNGDFPIEIVDFPIKNGDFPIKNGGFSPNLHPPSAPGTSTGSFSTSLEKLCTASGHVAEKSSVCRDGEAASVEAWFKGDPRWVCSHLIGIMII